MPEPIGKGRSSSTSSSVNSEYGNTWRAPGSERDDVHVSVIIVRTRLQY